MTTLRELFAGLPAVISPSIPELDPEVTGLRQDSRSVAPGDLFAALVGEHFDGRRYSAQAVERGAIAVMGPEPAPEDLTVPWVAVDDPRPLLGHLAARLYGAPQERLRLVGVTGTNGKGTVARLVAGILEAAGFPSGLGGTLGYRFADHDYAGDLDSGGPRTTLEALELYRVLNAMADDGARATAMEVSSHGLEMSRVAGLEFEVGAFTNLSHDHLDFHGDLESYYQAKRRLFADHLADPKKAVVTMGDEWAERLAAEIRSLWGDGAVLTCAEDEGDVSVVSSWLDLDGTAARLATPHGELEVTSHLLGRFNLLNILTAVAVAEAMELPHDAVVAGVAEEAPLVGRMEPVDREQDFPVLVDYAHTPAGLAAALSSIRELSDRRIVVVFGCGGDRDREKRPEMGRVAGRLADLVIATSDNPRGEDPEAILDDVEAGLRESGARYERLVERREAIRRGVEVAAIGEDGAEWTVLVAGKGHEAVQIVGESRIPFLDRREVEDALALHGFDGEEDDDG